MQIKNPPFVRVFRHIYVHYWRLYFTRMEFGFRIDGPGLSLIVGYDSPPCRVCGTRALISWPTENPGAAICPDCCHHPDHEWERDQGAYCCVECGEADYEMERDYYED